MKPDIIIGKRNQVLAGPVEERIIKGALNKTELIGSWFKRQVMA